MKEHAWALVAAILLDALAGDPEKWPHPVRWMGAAYNFFERHLRRRKFMGYIGGVGAVVIVSGLSFGLPALLLFFVRSFFWVHLALESLLLYWCLSVRNLSDEALAVDRALLTGRLPMARKRLARIVGRDTAQLKETDIARAAVETVGESFVDGFLSPVFWGLWGGAPLAFAFKAVSTGDSMIGHPEPPYREFGWAAARMDDFLNFIPARLVFLVLAPAAWVCGLSPGGLLGCFWRDRLRHASPNAAHGEAAFAGALRVKLGGLNFYGGRPYRQAVLNAAVRPCGRKDIPRAVRLLWAGAACTVSVLLFLGWGLPW